MGRRNKCPEPERQVVTFFTGQEIMTALYKKYPERFKNIPDQARVWFRFVEGGMAVEILE